MPEISRFFGIVIRIHYADHSPPHFHAVYQGRSVEIDIRTLAIIEGRIAPRALGLTLEWAALHQEELATSWQLAAAGQAPRRIAPLQ